MELQKIIIKNNNEFEDYEIKEYNVYTPKQCKSIIKAYDLKNYLINGKIQKNQFLPQKRKFKKLKRKKQLKIRFNPIIIA